MPFERFVRHWTLDDMPKGLPHKCSFASERSETDNRSKISESEVVDDSSPSTLSHFASQILYKREYLGFYLATALVTASLMIYDVAHRRSFKRDSKEASWFIALDAICVLALLLEIVLRYFATKVKFWQDMVNVFDLSVFILCILSICLYYYVPDSEQVGVAILCLRYATQLLRMAITLKWFRNQNRAVHLMEDTRIDIDCSLKQPSPSPERFFYRAMTENSKRLPGLGLHQESLTVESYDGIAAQYALHHRDFSFTKSEGSGRSDTFDYLIV